MRSDPFKELRKQNSSWALPNTSPTSCLNTSLIEIAGLKSKALTLATSSAQTEVSLLIEGLGLNCFVRWHFCELLCCWCSPFCEMGVERHCVTSALWFASSIHCRQTPTQTQKYTQPSRHNRTCSVPLRIHALRLFKLFSFSVGFRLPSRTSATHFLG